MFAQFVPMLINIVLTPYVIHGFGLSRYGLFMLVTALVAVLGRFDGGLGSTSARFLGVLAGRDDPVTSTRLLCTVSSLIVLVAGLLTGLSWPLAPPFTHVIKMPDSLRPETIFLLRSLMGLIGLGMVRNLLTAAISARQRFAFVSLMNTAMYSVYVIGIVLSVAHHWGLKGIAITFIAQQILSILALAPAARRHVDRRGLGFLSRAETREFFSYAAKLQLVGIAALVNDEVDTLIVGAILAVRQVGLFEAGTNFAENVAGVPFNAMGPVGVMLANVYGRDGRGALDHEFQRIQRRWVQGMFGWTSAGTAAVWFGVTAWLGPRFDASGTIAVIFMAAGGIALLPPVMLTYLQVLGHPGIEARYAGVCMVINIGLTIPLVFTGIIGVATATALANAAAALFLLWVVRRRLGPEVPSFLAHVPLRAGCVTAAVCVGLELLLRPLVPRGPIGLFVSAIPAAMALVVYLALLVGLRRASHILRRLPAYVRHPREILVREQDDPVGA
jgi:O-antigen/teichoic acid export membrane protein